MIDVHGFLVGKMIKDYGDLRNGIPMSSLNGALARLPLTVAHMMHIKTT